LIAAFSIALKHKLRYEPYIDYSDMRGYVGYLDTFAKKANEHTSAEKPKQPMWKTVGEWLGIAFVRPNPRRQIKEATRPLGNLPLEILVHLQSYLDSIIDNGTLKTPIYQVQSSK
jgi:putative membrane protein